MTKTPGKKIDKKGFTVRAIEIHGNKYDYSNSVYVNYHTPIIIKCSIHGEFLQTPAKHISCKHGCPKCGGTSLLNLDLFVRKSEEVHGKKYDYNNSIYINHATKIKIICSKHGLFYQTPNRHLQGDGCPKCNSSRGETRIRKYLNEHQFDYKEQLGFETCRNKRKLPFDFVVNHKSKVYTIEYYGEQHYDLVNFSSNKIKAINKFEKIKYHDEIKEKWCEDNNIPLCIIPYSEFCKIELILNEFLGAK